MKFMILYIYMHIHILFVKHILIMIYILYLMLQLNSCFATILYDVYVCMIILVLNKGLLYTNERQK